MKPDKIALVALTQRGADVALRIRKTMPSVQIYLPDRLKGDAHREGFNYYEGSVRLLLSRIFTQYRGLILHMPVGAAVRLMAPLLVHKHQDPAVVVVDEMARYAVSLLSAHQGGGNCLTRRVADILGAEPIITTGSDATGATALDELGKAKGWVIENPDRLARLGTMLLDGEMFGIVQESGDDQWIQEFSREGSEVFRRWESAEGHVGHIKAWIVVSHRILSNLPETALIYRPRVLVLGIGCSRGVTEDEIEELVARTFEQQRLSRLAIDLVATIDLKSSEAGLIQWAARHGYTIRYFSAAQLNQMALPERSSTVFHATGAWAVSRPAALLAARGGRLIVAKVKSPRVTVSVVLKKAEGE